VGIEIGVTEKLFNLSEAQALLPLIQSITQKHCEQLEPIQLQLNIMLSNDPRRHLVEFEYQQIVARWRTKVEQLGVVVAGLWIVNFDVGNGFLSWRYPELSVSYFLEKHENFSERVKLLNYIEETDPDWAL